MNHKKKRFNKKKKRQRKRAILAIRILIVITVFVGVKFIPKRENQNLQMENNRTSDSEQSNNTEETKNKEEIETPKLDNSGYTSFEEDPNADDAAVVAANTKGLLNRTKTYPVRTDGKKVVYLTFDDGPRMGTTNIILDILKKEGVPATFFVTNSGPDSLILREFRENHSVALHSSSHNYSYIYSSLNNYFSDLSSVHDRVYKITGYDSRIIRFPGGSSNTVSRKYSPGIMTELTKEVVQKGYKYYDWNINSGDAGETTDPNVIIENVTSKLSKDRENVILMHDIKPYTRDALERIIKIVKERGYQFDKITTKTDMMVQKINN